MPRSLPAVLVRPVLIGLTLLVLAMTGCGSSDNGVAAKSGSEILAATRAAAQSASSVHLVSKLGGSVKTTLNVRMARDRAHAQVASLGAAFEVVRIGDTLYVRGNRIFTARLGALLKAKLPAHVWLKGPASGVLRAMTSVTEIATEVPLVLGGRQPVTKGARVKVDGQSAIVIKQQHTLYDETLYVAATGKPYPLKLTETGQETGQITFTNWNDSVTVTPPAHAIDISKLQPAKKG